MPVESVTAQLYLHQPAQEVWPQTADRGYIFAKWRSEDLPRVSQLGSFKGGSEPDAQIQSCDGPEQTIAVVPRERLGRHTVASLIAAERKPDARSRSLSSVFPATDCWNLHLNAFGRKDY